MRLRVTRIVCLFWLCLSAAESLRASELELASPFSDHMVLQRDKPVRVWGQANAGAQVTVEFANQRVTVTADPQERWLAELAPLPANSTGRPLLVRSGDQTRTIEDVLVGEVWLLGGQSNMEMPLWLRGDGMMCAPDTRLVLGTDHPWLRILRVPRAVSRSPLDQFAATWQVSRDKDEAISEFSALGYYLGVQLHERLNVPIGLIDTSWGGTIAAAWCSRKALDAIPEATDMVRTREAAADAWTESGARQELAVALADWERRVAVAKAENKPLPGRPELRPDPGQDRNFPAGPFQAMIWPLRHFALRGVFFYQGENNLFDRADPFAKTFPAVVTSWRETLGDARLPFCIFQICCWADPGQRELFRALDRRPVIQELQHKTHLAIEHTGFVVTNDLPHTDIHPIRKRPIAERALRWARATLYGEPQITWGAPVLEATRHEDSRIVLTLRTPGNETLELTGEPAGFVIAGEDGKFVPAQAKIVDGRSIVVWSDDVPEPVHVRYDWSGYPFTHLQTKSGLPAGPFRTDDFSTADSRM